MILTDENRYGFAARSRVFDTHTRQETSMAKTPHSTPGARTHSPAATPNPSPSDRGTSGGTDLPANTPVDGEATDNSGAAPPQPAIVPEPFNPNFDNHDASNTEVGSGVPGLGGAGDEPRITVETTGEFQIQDPYTLDLVPHEGSASVRDTSFIQTAIADGRLKLA